MGLEFRNEEQRNPTTPNVLQKEYDLMFNFIEEDGLAIRFDTYKMIVADRERLSQLEITSNGFEEV